MPLHRVQIDVEGQEIGLPRGMVDDVLVEVEAVEIGGVAIFGPDIGAEVVHRIAVDAMLQPGGNRLGRQAADQLLVQDLVAGAQERGEVADQARLGLDQAEAVLEALQEVAAGLRIDALELRIGVEFRFAQEQALVERAGLADVFQQRRAGGGIGRLAQLVIAEDPQVLDRQLSCAGDDFAEIHDPILWLRPRPDAAHG